MKVFLLLLSSLLLSCSLAAMYHDFVASAGGYSVIMDDNNHPRLQQAAEFALAEAMELQKYSFLTTLSTTSTSSSGTSSSLPAFTICQAYQQVVAGMNLRMVIMVQDTDGSCLGAFATTIYDRFGELSVTDWSPAPVDCDIAQRMEAGSYVATGALESFFSKQP